MQGLAVCNDASVEEVEPFLFDDPNGLLHIVIPLKQVECGMRGGLSGACLSGWKKQPPMSKQHAAISATNHGTRLHLRSGRSAGYFSLNYQE